MAEKREGRGDQNTIEFLPRAEQVSLNRKMALWSQLMRWKMGNSAPAWNVGNPSSTVVSAGYGIGHV